MHKKPPLSAALLVPETDLPCLFIHMLNDGQRLHMIPFLTQKLSAHLLSFLNHDADAFHRGAGILAQLDEPLKRLAVGKEVIDDEHMILRS